MRNSHNFNKEEEEILENNSMELRKSLGPKAFSQLGLNSDSHSREPIKRTPKKKLKKIHLISNLGNHKKIPVHDSPFINGKRTQLRYTPGKNSGFRKQLRRSDSCALNNISHGTIEDETKVDSSGKTLNKRRRKNSQFMKGLKKRMKIRSHGDTRVGFDPGKEKVNQDRKVEFEFKVDKTKVRCYAIADGHGKINFNQRHLGTSCRSKND